MSKLRKGSTIYTVLCQDEEPGLQQSVQKRVNYKRKQGVVMAYCSKCGEKMEEHIVYTPKTHKEKGREFICPVHGVDKHPTLNCVGQTNPTNHGCRDWGTILNNK